MADIAGVHAMTDVTGFGLLGHLLEMCRGASLNAGVNFPALPLFRRTQAFAEAGIGTGGAKRNWTSYGHEVAIPTGAPEWWRGVLCDPQTSGGLLIACSTDSVPQVVELLGSRGFGHSRVIGNFQSREAIDGDPHVRVR